MTARIDLTGQRFGRLTTIRHVNGHFWEFQCDCGAIVTVRSVYVRRGHTQSCGCQRAENFKNRKHGLRGHPVYQIWKSIVARTTNPGHNRYECYGGRGIAICDEWRHDPATFVQYVLDTIGDKPDGQSIDRIDNDRGYERGNLRWATPTEQAQNRRSRYR